MRFWLRAGVRIGCDLGRERGVPEMFWGRFGARLGTKLTIFRAVDLPWERCSPAPMPRGVRIFSDQSLRGNRTEGKPEPVWLLDSIILGGVDCDPARVCSLDEMRQRRAGARWESRFFLRE